MSLVPFERTPLWQRALRWGTLVGSLVFHLVLVNFIVIEPPQETAEAQWIDMTVVEPPPPPPPPEPKAEAPKPEKPKAEAPKPEKIEVKDMAEVQPPTTEPPKKRKVRRIQGLSAKSFVQGSGTGIEARAGTDLQTAATSETMSVEEAAETVAYGALAQAPSCRRPSLEVPDEVVDLELQGSVHLLLDITETGRVANVRVKRSLHPAADAACVRSYKKMKCKPGTKDGVPVIAANKEEICTFKAIN